MVMEDLGTGDMVSKDSEMDELILTVNDGDVFTERFYHETQFHRPSQNR